MSNPYFSFKKFTVWHDRCAMKVTTDSCILGSYVSYLSPNRILDIGSGSGILCLMAAQNFPKAIIHGVEINKEAFQQSVDNVLKSPWHERIELFHQSIQSFIMKGFQYDLIISNPPYYQQQLKSGNLKTNYAKHDQGLNAQIFVFAVSRLLTGKGVFFIIMPPESFEKIKTESEIMGIYLFDCLKVYEKEGTALKRIVGGFSREKNPVKKRELIIRDDEGNYSAAFKRLLKEYYLAF